MISENCSVAANLSSLNIKAFNVLLCGVIFSELMNIQREFSSVLIAQNKLLLLTQIISKSLLIFLNSKE